VSKVVALSDVRAKRLGRKGQGISQPPPSPPPPIVMPWGKFAGQELRYVPGSYLFYVLEQGLLEPRLACHVCAELKSRIVPRWEEAHITLTAPTPEQASYLRGKRYNREKGNREDNLKQNVPKGQNVTSDTAERLAEEYKVSRATIERDGQFAAAVDTLATNIGEEVRQQILTRDAPLTKETVLILAKESPEKQQEIVARGPEEIKRIAAQLKREEKQQRQAARLARREQIPDDLPQRTNRYEVRIADVADLSFIADGSVDCIITDPPYPQEFLHVYKSLAVAAVRAPCL